MSVAVACLAARAAGPPGKAEVRATFQEYAGHFVQPDGRVVDRAGGGITTSEGQSYAMLRAVWVGDRDTFQQTRSWMEANLQAGNSGALPAWKWGQREDGSWGVLDPNPASDADVIIAYALLLGSKRFDDPSMRTQALALLDALWTSEIVTVADRLVLLPGPWAANQPAIKVNPSYSLPFAYRVFAQVEPERPWMQLVDDTYWLLDAVTPEGGLPPDWAWLDAVTGAVVPPPDGHPVETRYGFEAMRIPWMLAAEVRWYDEARARALLGRLDHLRVRWHRDGSLPAVIEADGSAGRDYDYLGMYGALLPAWGIVAPDDAKGLYNEVILAARTVHGWGPADDYYAHNWVWFGSALWSNKTGRGPTPIGRFDGRP